MDITLKSNENIQIAYFEGELNFDYIQKVKDNLLPLAKDEKIKAIILNFKNLALIDSSGIGMILNVYQTLKKRDAKFAVCCLNSTVEEIFEITQLGGIITITATEEDALSLV